MGMNLNESQQKTVTAWVAEGMKLSEIQNRLSSEFGLRLTYMEVRLLVDDLKLKLKDPEPPKASPPPILPPTAPIAPESVEPEPSPVAPDSAPSAGNVSVAVDQLARPGALVSGKVKFSDGKGADWYLDQTGRLGVIPQEQGYKPSAADVQQFQMALEREMTKMGF